MSANKREKARRKPEGKCDPFPETDQAASCTECTGLLPAQIETEEQGENVAALQGIHRILPADPDL